MATRVSPKKQLKEEFEQFTTRDPEAFFETMLIDIRRSTMQPLDSKLMDFQKLVFKNWFRRYEKELRRTVEADSALIAQSYNDGLKAGKLRILRQLLSERWTFLTPGRLKRYIVAVKEDRL